jgi:cation diffusion facilitator CzcD-associated flavoprotein CzcO
MSRRRVGYGLWLMGTQQFDVVIVGAGFGGIGAAIQLNRLGYDDIVIVDREDDLGGTWHVNHYPGLIVGVSSTTYSYWFEPNPYRSRLFAPGAELKRCAGHVADNYNVRRYMRFNTTVDGARWGIFGWIRHMSTSKKVA